MLTEIFAGLILMGTSLISTQIRPIDGSAVLISDTTMSVMVELSSRHPFCKMHTDRGDIQRMLLLADPRRVRQVPRESVLELEEVCKSSGSHGPEFRGGLGFIYPGTKWCGPGTTAIAYDELGQHAGEDRCCREHDVCPDVLNVGECRRGLCNTGTFTRSHCDCDARLRKCLQTLNTETANTLGAIFYNVVQVTCFQERSPCSAHQRFEDFFYNKTDCDYYFKKADFYVPLRLGNLISELFPHLRIKNMFPNQWQLERSLHDKPMEKLEEQLDGIKTRIGVQFASIGLAAINIFKEIVNSPRTLFESVCCSVSANRNENFDSISKYPKFNRNEENSNSNPLIPPILSEIIPEHFNPNENQQRSTIEPSTIIVRGDSNRNFNFDPKPSNAFDGFQNTEGFSIYRDDRGNVTLIKVQYEP